MAKHYRRLVVHSNLILAFFFPPIPARVIPGKYFHLLPPLSWFLFLVSLLFGARGGGDMLRTIYTSLSPLITGLMIPTLLVTTTCISFQNHGTKIIITQHKPCHDSQQIFEYANPLVLWFMIGLVSSVLYICATYYPPVAPPLIPTSGCVCCMDFCCTMCLTNTFMLCSVLFVYLFLLKYPAISVEVRHSPHPMILFTCCV
jgi:hypothetical protein